jgi:hypothetical protein
MDLLVFKAPCIHNDLAFKADWTCEIPNADQQWYAMDLRWVSQQARDYFLKQR